MGSRAVPVAITSVTAADDPSAGLAAAQTLRNDGARRAVIALATSAFADGLQSLEAVDEIVVVPSPHGDPAGCVRTLTRLARRRRLVLLPGSARDVIALAPYRRALALGGIGCLLPPASQTARLPFLGVSRLPGVSVPRHAALVSGGRDTRFRGRWRFPVIVSSSGGASATVRTAADLGPAVSTLAGAGPERVGAMPGPATLSVREAIEGTEFSVAALGAGPQLAPSVVAARPLVRSQSGAVWAAVTTTDPRLLAAARQALRAVRWTGPAELELVLDRGGSFWFTGLRPSFPSWISLAEAAGAPLVHEYVRRALGGTPRRITAYRDGLLMSRVAIDVVAALDDVGRLAVEGAVVHDGSSRRLRAATRRQAGVRAAR